MRISEATFKVVFTQENVLVAKQPEYLRPEKQGTRVYCTFSTGRHSFDRIVRHKSN